MNTSQLPPAVTAEKYTSNEDSWRVSKFGERPICGGSNQLNGNDAAMIVEAFNVYSETGKSPRELVARIVELETALQDLIYKVFPKPQTNIKS